MRVFTRISALYPALITRNTAVVACGRIVAGLQRLASFLRVLPPLSFCGKSYILVSYCLRFPLPHSADLLVFLFPLSL